MNEKPTPDEIRALIESKKVLLGEQTLEEAKEKLNLSPRCDRLIIEATPEELDAEAEALAKRLREKAEKAAAHAVKNRVEVSISPGGHVRRNGPCPCGSGRKFKKCCIREVKDPESEKRLPPPRVLRNVYKQQKGKKSQ